MNDANSQRKKISSTLNIQVSEGLLWRVILLRRRRSTTSDKENYSGSLHTLNLASRNGNKIFDEFQRGPKSNVHIDQEASAPDIFCIPVKTR
jgi:hypothetical protein